MNFDVFTISALVDEFMDTLVGGRIQDVIDVDDTGLGLEIYAHHQRRYLYLSADPMNPRVHVVGDKLRRGLQKPTQLGLLFRRYIERGLVSHVSQPAWERIINIDVESEDGEFTIIVEPMPRRSNVLLIQNGTILDCIRRVGPEDNSYRLSLPNHEYVPPPPLSNRLDPIRLKDDDFYDLLQAVEKPSAKMHKVLTGRIFGMSPLLAKEVVFRATGDVESAVSDLDSDTLYDAFATVVQPLLKREWQPGIGTEDGVVATFSPYPLTFTDEWQPMETMSEAITEFYGAITGPDAYNEAKKTCARSD